MNASRLLAQVVKELLSLLRDPRARAILVLPPLLQLLIFSFAATLEVRNATIAVFNEDPGPAAEAFIAEVSHASFVGEVIRVHDSGHQRQLLEQGRVLLALHIPETFSRDRLAGAPATVQVLLNGQKANTAQVALGYLEAMALAQDGRVEPLVTRHDFNPNLIYRWYVVPSLSGILSMFIALVVTALIPGAGLTIGLPWWTWIVAPIIVWVVTAIAAFLLPAVLLKKKVEARREG